MTGENAGVAKRKCPSCGSPVSATAQFCRACGARIEGSAAATPAEPAPEDTSGAGAGRPRRKIPLPAIVAGALMAGAVIVIGVIALTGGGDESDDTSTVEATAPTATPEVPSEAPEVPPEPPSAPPGQTGDEQFDQVAIGQTMDEVRAVLGEPEASETDLGGTRECWYFGLSDPDGAHTVCFDQDGLVMQRE
jgi:zinc-ribbon domain